MAQQILEGIIEPELAEEFRFAVDTLQVPWLQWVPQLCTSKKRTECCNDCKGRYSTTGPFVMNPED